MPKLLHYRDKCIGCGVCQQMQPHLWRMSKKDGKATLIHSIQKKNVHQLAIHADDLPVVNEVIRGCPSGVIRLG